MGDDDELAGVAQLLEERDEATEVGVVERGLDLVGVVVGSQPAEPGLAVPLTAVRGMGSDAYVILRDDAATATGSGAGASARPDERRVPVTVGVTGGGYAAVTGELEAGDRVKVS